ncbi:MAG: hypothetical protein JWP74_1243 [Marmoricola sp.]|nr:hypothetical protein [Marmoricola sp.]
MEPPQTDAEDEGPDNEVALELPWQGAAAAVPASRRSLAAVAVLVVAVIALAVLVPFQIRSYNHARSNNETALRQQATVAITTAVVELTSPSAATADTYVKDMLSRSTGAFKDQLGQIAQTFASTVKSAGVTATATVASSGISSLNVKDRKVTMVVAVVQELKNNQTPKAEARYYRLRVVAEKTGDRWLISDMRFVA